MIFVVIAASLFMVSCNNANKVSQAKDTTIVDTANVDSTMIDSLAVDSVSATH